MQYLFLLYHNEAQQMTPDQSAQARTRQWAILDETTRKGILRGAAPLQPTTASMSVRFQNEALAMTDGPFVETKESLGGFYLIECQDIDEAKHWGGRLAQTGCATAVEIRPLAQIPGRVEAEDSISAVAHA